jgi:glycosyltransferase involved in cell wall biosynthesis
VTIYHVEFAKTGTGMSGGEKVMGETVRYLAGKKHKNVILTTDNGLEAYSRAGVTPSEFIEFKIIPSYEFEKRSHPFVSYLSRLPQISQLLKPMKLEPGSVVICHSNFFPNSIATWLLSRKFQNIKILYWHHTLPPKLFRGYKGEFKGKFNFPNLALVHYHINQFLYEKLHRRDGVILTPTKSYIPILRKHIKRLKIAVIAPYGGLDGDMEVAPPKKEYDIAWMGRFQNLKGLTDLVEIAERVAKRLPNVQILVIGGGTPQEEAAFRNEVEKRKLDKNIQYKGFINGSNRYQELSKARLMAITSYFESYGIVNIEALKLGLPMVAYDLPTYGHLGKGLVRVRIGDKVEFANKVINLLSDRNLLSAISREASQAGVKYSWAATNKEIEDLILNYA